MKPELAQKLGAARDFCALTKAVLAICEPYGPVHAFRMVHNRGAARVACLIELDAPKEHPALARALGATVFNGAACLEIPVDRSFGASPKVAALPAQHDFETSVAAS